MQPEMQTLKTGTTTLGLVAKDAVILGAEKKATMGYLIESKLARKVHPLDEHLGLTIAGSVGDAQAMVRLLRAQFKLYKLDRGAITVKAAATLMMNILQGSKWMPFFNQFILGGYDSNGPQVYSIDLAGGSSSEDKFFSTGSGSPYAYGVLEANFRENMSVDEACALALRAIRSAIERDIGSGGRGFTIAVIDKNGYRELSENEIKQYMK